MIVLRWTAAALAFLTLVASGLPAEPPAEFPLATSFSAVAVYRALERAYPDWVVPLSPLPGSGIAIGGKSFVWAEGRILSPALQSDWVRWAPQPFYEYPAKVPNVARWTDAQVAQAEAHLADRRSQNLARNSDFFDTLWSIHDRGSADDNQQKTWFLGLKVTVHKSLVVPLQHIEKRLTVTRREDPDLDQFLSSLVRLEGYNYRDIAETQSRSNHAYGAAIDLIPRSYGSRNPYWLWAPQDSPGWYRTAWSKRWEPHPTVVRYFEDEGFVWGGKWLMFDTIHFEYRPEILVLNGLR
ncbi:MAG TPA: M15 family metallopeptidase [Spirochaetia bacterium]|nr:M15 family metallopeptidase [Spirochaetia bacterium]